MGSRALLIVALSQCLSPFAPVGAQRWAAQACEQQLPSFFAGEAFNTSVPDPQIKIHHGDWPSARLQARALQMVMESALGTPTSISVRGEDTETRLLSIAEGSVDASVEEWTGSLFGFDDRFRCPEGCHIRELGFASQEGFPHRISDMNGRQLDHNW